MSSPSAASAAAGRRRPAARGRAVLVAALLSAVAVACGSIPPSEVELPEGRTFIPMVPDSVDDVGLAPSIAIDGAGLPTISYFGFTAPLAEGEIPVARPVGAPFLTTADGDDAGAVLLAGMSESQIWNRGAVAQPRETPAGLTVPFGPAAEPSLASLTPGGAEGTDVAIAGTGIHAAWTVNTGVWYGLGPTFEIGAVEETRGGGAPSIVVDGDGSPIVAFAVAGAQPEVRVAEQAGEEGWRITTVATLSACGRGCPPGVQMALLGEEPLVVVADPQSGELTAAHREGGVWSTEVVATDVIGGASVDAAGDSARISFYTASGVSVATGRPGSWSVQEVAAVQAAEEDAADDPATPPTTAVAVDDEGTAWLAWEDADGVHLASGGEGELQEVDLHGDTAGGARPTVAVTDDGATVYLAWYFPEDGDLRFGTYAELPELKIAAPSPPPTLAPAVGPEDCGDDGEPILDVTAQGIAFNTNCLVAPAGEAFTITFDNQDPDFHNVAIYTDSSAAESLFVGETFPGVAERTYDVEPQDAGDYFFRCDVHPDQMTGAFVVVEAGAGGGGDGGGAGGEGGGTGGGGGGG